MNLNVFHLYFQKKNAEFFLNVVKDNLYSPDKMFQGARTKMCLQLCPLKSLWSLMGQVTALIFSVLLFKD